MFFIEYAKFYWNCKKEQFISLEYFSYSSLSSVVDRKIYNFVR